MVKKCYFKSNAKLTLIIQIRLLLISHIILLITFLGKLKKKKNNFVINIQTMKKLFFTSMLCFMVFYATSQIKLLDLSVIPVNEPSSDSITVLVQFKARNISDIQNIQLIFETQNGMADVLQKTAIVTQQANINYTVFENHSIPIENYNISLYCKMSNEQFALYSIARVVVQYNDNSSAFLVLNND